MSVNPDISKLGTMALELAPLFVGENKTEWSVLCNLIAADLAVEFSVATENVRVFVLECNNGSNTDTLWPVVAQNDNPKIVTAENPISRSELLDSSGVRLRQYVAQADQAWVARRTSSSTNTDTIYGTSQIKNSVDTCTHILKLAIALADN